MGRGEGPGCYCYANNLFKKYIDILQNNYDYIIMDNEAGMEHLSRGTTSNVNYLLIISDPSPKGILAASRIKDLSDEININAEKIFLIVNRVNGKLDDRLKEYIEEKKLDLLGIINMDDNIYEMDISGKTIFNIPEDSLALKQVKELIEKLKL
jgi:CO dehydrogenase maturation factor